LGWSVALVLASENLPIRRGSVAGFVHRRGVVRGLAVAAGLALGSALAGCGSTAKIVAGIKLTFVLSEDGVRSTHVGVWRMTRQSVTAFPNPGSSIAVSWEGDAIPMHLKAGGTVFALLASAEGKVSSAAIRRLWDWDCIEVLAAGYGVNLGWTDNDSPGWRQLIAEAPTSPIEVSVKDYPTLLFFADPLRPETGRVVDPRNLVNAGEPDVRVDSLHLQVVDEPVGRGIQQHLPWLRSSKRSLSDLPAWNDFRRHPEYFSR